MASRTWWPWVWVNSGSWWWTGRPGVLRFMGSQRVGHDWATELNWVRYFVECLCWNLSSSFSWLDWSNGVCGRRPQRSSAIFMILFQENIQWMWLWLLMLTLLTWVVYVRFLHCKVTLFTCLSMLCSLKRKSPCSIYTYKGGKFLLTCVVYLHKIVEICLLWRFVCSFIFFNHWFLSVWTWVFILCFII